VTGEPPIDAAAYGPDRAFVVLSLGADEGVKERGAQLERAGHPVIRLRMQEPSELGAQMFLWEFATAVAGALMDINPFDQPDVEAAKKASRAALDSGSPAAWSPGDPDSLFANMAAPDLAVICAFAPRRADTQRVLDAARAKVVHAHAVATMAGFGPRYLHSTGQLHKGGPPGVRALVVLDEPDRDEPIPDSSYGFRDLVVAQASGDARALGDAGRAVVRTTWPAFEEWATT
jgi:hypothetical protein